MKTKNKMMMVLSIAAIIGLSSCKKTYECHCDTKAGGEEHFDVKNTKSKAESECKAKGENSSVYSSCEIE